MNYSTTTTIQPTTNWPEMKTTKSTTKSKDLNAEGQPRVKRPYKARKRTRSPTAILRSKINRRGKANDRERGRMHGLNSALERLRTALPKTNPKMTKIETLRFAREYIWNLTNTLHTGTQNMTPPPPSSLQHTPTYNNHPHFEMPISSPSCQVDQSSFTRAASCTAPNTTTPPQEYMSPTYTYTPTYFAQYS